jgi:hypothetical protein
MSPTTGKDCIMRKFPVDDDLVTMIWEMAKPQPFEDLTFSDALRRVLSVADDSLTAAKAAPSTDTNALLANLAAMPPHARTRAPKADLRELVRLGILKDGQELIFFDYKGHPQSKHRAKVAGADLTYKGTRHSMSGLSSLLLKQDGYIAEAVRGPDHWGTVEGKRIRELWEDVLAQRSKSAV